MIGQQEQRGLLGGAIAGVQVSTGASEGDQLIRPSEGARIRGVRRETIWYWIRRQWIVAHVDARGHVRVSEREVMELPAPLRGPARGSRRRSAFGGGAASTCAAAAVVGGIISTQGCVESTLSEPAVPQPLSAVVSAETATAWDYSD